jgi:transposase
MWFLLGCARARLASKDNLTLDELVQELREQHGVQFARSSVGYWLHRLGSSHKKRCCQVSKNAATW